MLKQKEIKQMLLDRTESVTAEILRQIEAGGFDNLKTVAQIKSETVYEHGDPINYTVCPCGWTKQRERFLYGNNFVQCPHCGRRMVDAGTIDLLYLEHSDETNLYSIWTATYYVYDKKAIANGVLAFDQAGTLVKAAKISEDHILANICSTVEEQVTRGYGTALLRLHNISDLGLKKAKDALTECLLIRKKNAESRSKAKAAKEEETLSQSEWPSPDDPALTQNLKNAPILCFIESGSAKEKFRVNCNCVRCGNRFQIAVANSSSEVKCPVCKNNERGDCFSIYSYHSRYFTANLCKLVVDTRGKLMMEFAQFKVEFDKTGCVNKQLTDKQIIDPRKRKTLDCMRYNGEIAFIQSKQEIIATIKSSDISNSGYLEAAGLVESYAGDETLTTPEGLLEYVNCYKQFREIELVAKSSYPKLLMELVYDVKANRDPGIHPGKTISEVLNISPRVFKLGRDTNLCKSGLFYANRLLESDATATNQEIQRVLNEISRNAIVLPLIRDYHLRIRDILTYLDRVYMHQCIERGEAITEWSDYLNMARKIGYDLTNTTRLFPTSLKKEHDIATFAFNKIKDQIREKEFVENAQRAAAQLNYSADGYLVIVPEKVQDIIAEADAQHNCLRSYVEQLCEGKTSVAFIRKKESPDTSYITAEVRDGYVRQLCGKCNSRVTETKVLEFVRKWANTKKITCTY